MTQAEQRYLLRQGRHGMFLVNPRDKFIGRALAEYGEFSEWEMAALAHLVKPGAIVVEAGANIGALTVPLARKAGPEGCVFAYEPQRLAFQLLCANAALNELTNVVAIWAACGRAAGGILVPVIDPDDACNVGGLDIRGPNGGGWADGEQVKVETIDDLGLARCDLIKIDVEGMERDVVAGAAETIARCRPILYVENDRPSNGEALIGDIFDRGYRGWWHIPPLFNRENWAKRPDDVWFDETGTVFASINMLCVPAEREFAVDGLQPVERAGLEQLKRCGVVLSPEKARAAA